MARADQEFCLLLADYEGLINDEEVMLLYDVNSSKNLSLPFWKYDRFSLDNTENHECISEFQFEKEDLFLLHVVLQIPDRITCYNGTVISGIEALCVCLKRYAYPCRYLDIIPRFGRPVLELCIINNYTLNFIYDQSNYLLNTMNQAWLSANCLQLFADAIYARGALLDNCWGFIDGTVRPCCRPGISENCLQWAQKSSRHRISISCNSHGLIANLFAPVDGRKHDSGMLGDSGLCTQLQQYARGQNHNILCLYGDPAYPVRPQLLGPFKGAGVTQIQQEWNQAMSKVRINVEWILGDIINYFKFLDFKKGLKLQLSAIGKCNWHVLYCKMPILAYMVTKHQNILDFNQ